MFIRLREYERIFQVISAIIESEEGDPSHACIHYSLFGAFILKEHFKANAKVRCGLAAYYLGGDHQVLCFGEETNQGISSGEDGFHCWVEVDGWVLDFMAPRFSELVEGRLRLEPKMFQKQLSEMSADPNEMRKAGDFFLAHNEFLMDTVLQPVCDHLGIQDLARIASRWFKRPPKNIPKSVQTLDQNGQARSVQLRKIFIRSKW